MSAKKSGLGKGLDALFNENAVDSGETVTLKIGEIEPNRDQPRKNFDEQALSELAESIERHGLIQPIVVRPLANGRYGIVAGERRWRACRMAGLDTVPVVIKELDEKEYMEIALIENLQREDLNPVEEAQGYRTLIDTYSLTQEQLAESMGKSRSAVTNILRLLSLEADELEALKTGKITSGHARALLSAEGELRKAMFVAALEGASVRVLEKMAKQKPSGNAARTPKPKKAFYSEVELSLRSELGRKVYIKPTGKKGGTITLEFFNDDELSDIAKKLSD